MVFIKNKENFTCENCGFFVVGDGYTNHCPKCLWSKHVDINPGDRLASCGGLMSPIAFENEEQDEIVIHQCVICGYSKKNKLSKHDSYDTVIELAKERGNK